jgi:hypothetical protein
MDEGEFSTKTVGDPTLLSLRSRLSKIQETLYYFLAQPNISWNDALEKFNLLASQSYNLSKDMNPKQLKSYSLFPVQTLPDPNLGK